MNLVGTLKRFAGFDSQFIAPRTVDVWCPPRYEDGEARLPVIYMHDGQNLFEPISSIGGVAWEMDRAIARLMEAGKIPGALVVGLWNSDIRWREYMPQKPYESNTLRLHREAFINRAGGEPVSDAYLKFLVHEVKPFVDANFRTRPDPLNTFVMGSSMGGLISLYAISEYPEVFRGAACLSTNWPAGEHELVNEMARHLPEPQTHKLYFDYGTLGLDALYEPYQTHMDQHLRARGYVENVNWLTRKFQDADHNEAAWRARVGIALQFILD